MHGQYSEVWFRSDDNFCWKTNHSPNNTQSSVHDNKKIIFAVVELVHLEPLSEENTFEEFHCNYDVLYM